MILEEFDLNKYLKLEKAESYEEGREEGENRLNALYQYLLDNNKQEDLNKAIIDSEYRKLLYQEFHIT